MESSFQALLEQRRYVPCLLALNDRSQHCDLHWLDALQYLEDQSRPLMQELAAAEAAGQLQWLLRRRSVFLLSATTCRSRFRAKRHVGVTF